MNYTVDGKPTNSKYRELGRHLSNIFDHRRKDAEGMHCYSHSAMFNGLHAMRQEWLSHLDWINENVIGPPEATDRYSVEELEAMGMIGIYKSGETS